MRLELDVLEAVLVGGMLHDSGKRGGEAVFGREARG